MCTVALISALAMAFVSLSSAADPCAVEHCRIKFVIYSETQRRFFVQLFSAAWTSSNPLFILNKENAGHYLAEDGCNGEWKAHMMNELGDKESEFFFRVEGNAKVNITINDGPSGKLSPAKIQIEYCGQEPQVVEAITPKPTGADSVGVKQEVSKQAVAGSEPFVPNKLAASSGFFKPNDQADSPLTGDNGPGEDKDSGSRSANTAVSHPELTRQKLEAIANMCNVVCAKL